jgi:hypothetical protein
MAALLLAFTSLNPTVGVIFLKTLSFVGVVKAVQGQADLLEVVAARTSPRRLTGRLHGRQKEADERADDRDHDQELDQRESRGGSRCRGSPLTPASEIGPHGSHLGVFLWNLFGYIAPPSNLCNLSFRQLPRQQLFLSILRKSFDFA